MASKHTGPKALRDPPEAPAPLFQTSSYAPPPSPVSPQRAPAHHGRMEIPPLEASVLWDTVPFRSAALPKF